MSQHRLPVGLQLRRGTNLGGESLTRGWRNLLCGALPGEDLPSRREIDRRRVVLDELDDIVEVSRAHSLMQCAGLLGKKLFERVGRDQRIFGQVVWIGVEYWAVRWDSGDDLVLGNVEKHAW